MSRGCKLQCVVQFNLWIQNTMVSIWQLTRAFSNHSWILFGLEPFLYLFPWDGTLIYIFFIGTEPFLYPFIGTEPLYIIFHWDGTLLISFSLGRNPYIYIYSFIYIYIYIYISINGLSFASYYIWIVSITFLHSMTNSFI